MSKITEKITDILSKENISKERLISFDERYEKLVSKGAIGKSKYNLPLKDTIGKSYSFNNKTK